MRIDHIVVHVENNPEDLRAQADTFTALGYPFNPENGRGSGELRVSNINIGNEYIEVVRLLKPGVQSWMPQWVRYYDTGERGAYCIFLEVEDVERAGTSLKYSGVHARGPATLSYPGFLGLISSEAPYTIYYLPNFPESILHIALMQYKPGAKMRMTPTGTLAPNAALNGINGIRRLEVDLPNLDESLPMLRKLFPELNHEGDQWVALLENQRICFSQSIDHTHTYLRLATTTSQRAFANKGFSLANVHVRTIGG